MAGKTAFNDDRFPSVLDPLLQESVVDNRHMLEPQFSNTRKRQRSEQRLPQVNKASEPLPQVNEASEPLSKRHKPSYPNSKSLPPAAFWDDLSEIPLTKRALRELDRRNTLSVPKSPQYRRPHRPVTRRILAELKLFAKDGGPDLSGLRGVRVTSHVLLLKLTILLSAQRLLILLATQ